MAAELRGIYLESRTCQVYTGPCFANGEMGQSGKNAILAWNIAAGAYHGVDLAGLSVVAVIGSSETLGFQWSRGRSRNEIDPGGRSTALALLMRGPDPVARAQIGARVNRWFALSLNRLP